MTPPATGARGPESRPGSGVAGRAAPVGLADIPERVTVYEVGPRDGLQNEPGVVSVETKLELVTRLVAAGIRDIEVTSLVKPDAVPQLADAEELLSRLPATAGVRQVALVPNLQGFERAAALGVREVALPASATESFARANLGRSRPESLAVFTEVAARARERGIVLRGYISMCFGDPWEGQVEPGEVVAVAGELLGMGCREISLGDTTGVATPGSVRRLINLLAGAGVSPAVLAVHFHDTYGQALGNALEALRCGVTTVDASAGGLGGCPFAKSASGNLATEDLLWALDGLGISTGIDLVALAQTSLWLAGQLGRPSPSRTVQALARELGGGL